MGFIQTLTNSTLPGIISNAAGGILGMMLGKQNDQRQLEQQQQLQNMQEAGNMRMADYSFKKQLEMWHATNYQAQVKELKAAGLNPALLYGGGGGGGTTAGSAGAGSVSAGQAPHGGGEVLGMMQVAQQQQQLALIEAQKKNIEANTNKTNQETANMGSNGIDTQVKLNQIETLKQQVKNGKAQEALTQSQTTSQDLENLFNYDTYEDRQDFIEYNTNKPLEELHQYKRGYFDLANQWQ